jgi:hypothetical protein
VYQHGSNQFGTADLQTGAFTAIGNTGATLEDVAGLRSGPVYAEDALSNLYTINTATGAASSPIGNSGNNIIGIEVRGDGTLWGASTSALYSINPSNAVAMLVGSFGPSFSLFDLRFDTSGDLFLEGNKSLYSVNTATGAATLIGNTGFSVSALFYFGATLYGFVPNGTITIDTTTGVGTPLANNASLGTIYGTAHLVPGVPGDVNFDGAVNGLDISLVSSHWLQTGLGTPGDANGDRVVNGLDISVIASHWLQTGSGGAGTGSAVPEPSAIMLAGVGALVLLVMRSRRGRTS